MEPPQQQPPHPLQQQPDSVTRVQDCFFQLGQAYAHALRQAEQGGDVAIHETPVGGKEIHKLLGDTLELIASLPGNVVADEEEIRRLVAEEAQADAELRAARAKAQLALENVRRLRRNVASKVFQTASAGE